MQAKFLSLKLESNLAGYSQLFSILLNNSNKTENVYFILNFLIILQKQNEKAFIFLLL